MADYALVYGASLKHEYANERLYLLLNRIIENFPAYQSPKGKVEITDVQFGPEQLIIAFSVALPKRYPDFEIEDHALI